ncbi:MAG: hypothetical protein COA42_10075 [Alteromonadaceae bacterium]|nr:MAG: hypothetical protein COA42_10075 [Alteromonadaceae bacterium]
MLIIEFVALITEFTALTLGKPQKKRQLEYRMLDRKKLIRRTFALNTIPIITICIIISFLFISLNDNQNTNSLWQKKQFLLALYSSNELFNEHSTTPGYPHFNAVSSALLNDQHYLTVALFDSNKNLLIQHGLPFNQHQIKQHLGKNHTWEQNNRRFQLIESNAIDTSKLWILVSSDTQAPRLKAYRLTASIAITGIGASILAYLLSTLLINRQSRSGEKIIRVLNALQSKEYDQHLSSNDCGIYGPLANQLNAITQVQKHSQQTLRESVDQHASEWQESLDTMEMQNIKSDLAKKRAIKANEQKSTLLSDTRREISAPLNGITVFSKLLAKTPLNHQQKTHLDNIRNAAETAMQWMGQLNERHTEIVSGAKTVDSKVSATQHIVNDAIALFSQHQANSDKLKIDVNMDDVIADCKLSFPNKSRQILHCLINYTVELLGNTSGITVSVNRAEHEGEARMYFDIAAADVPIQSQRFHEIAAVIHGTLIEPHQTSSDQLINLTSARIFSQQLGDELQLLSSDAGIVFTFSTPLYIKPPVIAEPKNDTPQPHGILIVDDNPTNRKLAIEFVKELSIDIYEADCGNSALEIIASHRVSMIFMDIQMPGMSGVECTKKIRALEKDTRTPIIALTARPIKNEKIDLLIAGMDDFLSKPVSFTQLEEVVRRWLPDLPPLQHGKRLPKNLAVSKARNEPHTDLDDANLNMVMPVDIPLSLKLAKGKADLARDMLDMLIKSLPEDMHALIEMLNNRDYVNMQALTHKMHGGFCCCGVPKLRDLSRQLDARLLKNDYEHVADDTEAFFNECEQLLAWAEEHDTDLIFGLDE